MKRDFEYNTYSEDERLARLENRTAELLRRLEQVALAGGMPEYPAGEPEYQASEPGPAGFPAAASPRASARYADSGHGHPPDLAGCADPAPRPHGDAAAARTADRRTGGHPAAAPGGYGGTGSADYPEPVREYAVPGAAHGYPGQEADDEGDTAGRYAAQEPHPYLDREDGYAGRRTRPFEEAWPSGPGQPGGPRRRTEDLINRGRRHARRGHRRWRTIAIAAAAVTAGAALIAVVLPGGSPGWPASVATVQSEISTACQNPNVVSEPSQVNFACAKDTRQVLWVFSLLTSHDNAGYTNPADGRKGLEPIQPAQGGNIAWSLNLHHPYNPANPIDSLEVAARALNNIIGGATVTGSSGAPQVQSGLESSPANCARYTGSSALITRQGFPALCALPVSSPEGQAALVTDLFRQWMGGAPAQYATEAGVLFQNADNPGDPQVQSILSTLRSSGL